VEKEAREEKVEKAKEAKVEKSTEKVTTIMDEPSGAARATVATRRYREN